MLGACATASPAQAARSCRAKRIAIAYKPRGRTKAKRWCVPRPRIPRSQGDAAGSIVRLLERGKLSPKRLERLVRHLPARRERAFRRARERQVRRTTTAHAAAAQSQGEIPAGPGQAGFGYFSSATSSASAEDDEHATVRTTHRSKSRHEIFGPKCPDFDGNVVTKIAIVHTDERSSERRGKRTTITTDARITGTLSGGFTDEFEFRGPLALDLDFVIETRVATVIAATGKVIDRKPTATRRVRMTASIAPQSLGALETPLEAFSAMTITGAGGSHGRLSLDDFIADPPLVLALMGTVALARTEAATGFCAHDRQRRRLPMRGRDGRPGLADAGEGSVRRLHRHRARAGRPARPAVQLQRAGLLRRPRPESGREQDHAPCERPRVPRHVPGGASVAEVSTVSRRGYAPTLKIPISERRSVFPTRFTGSWRRVYTDAAGRLGMVETIDGTATFVRNPLIPPEAEAIIAIPYDIQSSMIKWSVSGSHTEAGCKTTYSGSGTDTAIPNTFVDTGMTLQDVHGNPAAPVPEPMPFYYSIRASSDPTDAPLFTITRSGTPGCDTVTQEPIIVIYLEIGSRADLSSETPPGEIVKSGDINLLAGHRHTDDGTGLPSDDTWSFRGSG